jgi:hypothetical protein
MTGLCPGFHFGIGGFNFAWTVFMSALALSWLAFISVFTFS